MSGGGPRREAWVVRGMPCDWSGGRPGRWDWEPVGLSRGGGWLGRPVETAFTLFASAEIT